MKVVQSPVLPLGNEGNEVGELSMRLFHFEEQVLIIKEMGLAPKSFSTFLNPLSV